MKAVEMTRGGKREKPETGFPPFPPRLEIAARFPHSHRTTTAVCLYSKRQVALRATVTHVPGLKCYPSPRPVMPSRARG